MSKFEEQKKKRSVLRSLTTKLLNNCNEYLNGSEHDPSVLNENIELLNAKYNSLIKLNEEIQETIKDEKEFELEIENSEVYSEKIISMKSKLEFLFKTKTKAKPEIPVENVLSNVRNSTPNSSVSHSKIKLPKLSINKFNGDPLNWLSFWDQFDNAIHQNNDLTDTDKFNYLLSFLSGAAINAVSGFSLSNENYSAAIELLKSRFGRTDLIINAHMGKLLNLEPVKNANNIFALRKLYDNIEIQIRSLQALNVTSGYGTLLTPILLKLIPNEMNLEFHKKRKSKVNFDVSELIEYLRTEIECREIMQQTQEKLNIQSSGQFQKEKIKNKYHTPTAATLKVSMNQCLFCDETEREKHLSDSCTKSVADRRESLKRKGFCFLCLKRANHLAKNCLSKIKCEFCGWKHNSLICERKDKVNDQKLIKREHTLTNKTYLEKVLLQTLIVKVRGNGKENFIRCLIDSGSQRSYISKFLAKTMKYECISENRVIHSLFGGSEVTENHKQYVVHLSSVRDDYHCNFKAYDQTKICSDIPQIDIKPFLNELKFHKVFLNDIEGMNKNLLYEYSPNEIHILIGADIAAKLLSGKIKRLESGLVCIETYLGWSIMGKIPIEMENKNEYSYMFSMLVSNSKIADLWQLDTLGILDPSETQTRKELEEQTMKHFLSTVKRDEEGRFQVTLPWIMNHLPLPSNWDIAEKRLKGTVKNLRDGGFLEEYEAIFKSWENDKIIEVVPENEFDKSCHYLPHHAVVRMSSKTTKIRPVFDGSAKLKGSPSINNCLEKGPNLIETIPAVINRFRWKGVGVSADIKKAFLQIGLDPKDRDYLRFLWWEQGNPEHSKTYRHRRVVFGISSSPFLLSATLTKLIEEVPENLRASANQLSESWYVDNLITSVDNMRELNKFKNDCIEILSKAKFELQEWAYNMPRNSESIYAESILEHHVSENQNTENLENSCEVKSVNILGIVWNLNDDTLSCDIRGLNESEIKPITKRTILSEVHKIYDPIGFTCPITLIPKILLQNCWELKVTWDEALPEEINKKFIKWKWDARRLEEIKIPRYMKLDGNRNLKLSFHIFCDASRMAYATCIYLRSESETEVSCNLVQARSRVAPLKLTSICRLELLACTIGVRLMKSIQDDLKVENIPTFYWTDSMNTLYWIKNEENWGVFVMNRVKEIRAFSKPEEWNYVPGDMNPADIPSRGCSVETLKSKRWHEGPAWLKLDLNYWPSEGVFPDKDSIDKERRKTVVSSLTNLDEELSHFSRISSFEKIIRITAWMARFIHNCRNREEKRIFKYIEVEDIKGAETIVWKIVQKTCFGCENHERLRHLKPFVDSSGLIRVKTRIFMRQDLGDFRTPIVLPPDHPIVTKLIMEKHEQLLHCGVQSLMAILREKFWILQSRRTIRKVLKNCVKCKRFDAKSPEVEPSPLPEDRVKDSNVFEVTGIDLAGPLILRNGSKTWIVLFTCAVYRAIHLEIVTALSTDNFLLAFRRFIARRGRPSIVYTDNGTNFVGTNSALKAINWDKIIEDNNVNRIKWKFIPPASPWWGGFWERMVGLMKNVLRKVLGNASLKYEEMITILCDCENILNSRPITYISEDCELEPLTPAMFFRDIKEGGVPDLDCIDAKYLQKRYAYRMKVQEDLRKRFRSEYLGQLKNYAIKSKKHIELSVGDIVLIGTNEKRIHWPLGKVIQLIPGKDGVLRLVKLRTKFGEILRPLQRLYPLEVNLETDQLIKDCVMNKKFTDKDVAKNYSKSTIPVEVGNLHGPVQDSPQADVLSQDSPRVTRCGRVVRTPKLLDLQNCSFDYG